ncbi:MAG: outer membrane beta-barrel protein [Desulfobacterales bacterium]|jgi:hypothetical protein
MMKKTAIAVLVGCLMAGFGPEGWAAEFKVIPSLVLRGQYNDNIFFDAENEESDYIGTVKPGLEIINRTERLDLSLAGHYRVIRYRDQGELDAEDYDGRGRLKYNLTPVLRLNAGALYDKSTQPDRDVVETGLIQNQRTRRRQRYNGGLEYTINEKAATTFNYVYQDDDWSSNDPDDEDWTLNSADMLFTYDLSGTIESTVGRVNFGYANADYETAEIDYYFATLGFLHQFSEIYSMQLDAGPRYTDSEFDDNQSDQKWGGRGYLALIYSGEFTRADLSASYDVDAASGRRGAVERTRFVADVRHRFLEKLWLGISGGYYLNKSSQDEFAQDEIDERTVRVRPRFNWEIHRYVSLEGAYEYIYVDDNADDTDTDRHNVYLQVTFAYPVIE